MPTLTEVTRARELLAAAIEKAFPGAPYTSSHDPVRGLVFTLLLPRSTAFTPTVLANKLPGWIFYDTTPRDGESGAYLADHPGISPDIKLALAVVPLGAPVHAPGKKLAPPLDFPICWVAFFEDVRRAYNTCEIFAYYEPGGWVIEVLGTTRDDLLHRDRGLQGYKFEPVPGELHTFRTNANQRHFLRLRFAHTGASRRPLPPPPASPAPSRDRLGSPYQRRRNRVASARMGIDLSSLNALLAQAKNMVSTGPRSSALCQHANEVPRGPCSCPQTCYCKQDGGCGGNRQWQMGTPSPDWILSRVELALPCGTTWEQNDTPAGLALTARPSTALQNVSLSLDNMPPGWSLQSIDASPRRLGIVLKHIGGRKVLLALHFDPLPDTDTGFWQKLTDPDSL